MLKQSENAAGKPPEQENEAEGKSGGNTSTVIMREMAPIGEMAPGCGKRSKK